MPSRGYWGEEIGHVNDLLVDNREHKVRFLRVAAGGFLGPGERKFLIPAVVSIQDSEVHVGQTREHVTGAPEYDPEVVQEEHYWEDVYGYWGYDPYWTAGYAYPGDRSTRRTHAKNQKVAKGGRGGNTTGA